LGLLVNYGTQQKPQKPLRFPFHALSCTTYIGIRLLQHTSEFASRFFLDGLMIGIQDSSENSRKRTVLKLLQNTSSPRKHANYGEERMTLLNIHTRRRRDSAFKLSI